eukprot:TRINITY_DN5862_c0_g1_i8.p1 TRINITY_DN5862_c0_g1~~TRINITY_DN5862_c0_g1_i8.p1  ORF type:complete len:237 (-),score=29.54 TRINITY_DN5862_c0_g1_i8:130-840(-)
MYSVPLASGILLASGNVGKELDTNWEDLNTYITRDGGYSWTEIRKGQYIPEIGDHGGIIVLADNQKPTTELLFTLDEGYTFKSCQFTTSNINVQNIVLHSWAGKKFLLFGTRSDNTTRAVVVSLDMSNVFPRACEEEDYEFTPQVGGGIDCLLGKKVLVKRKKVGSLCFNGEEHEAKKIVSNCTCTLDDYECDECFDFYSDLNTCVFSCLNDEEAIARLPKAPSSCKDFFNATNIG